VWPHTRLLPLEPTQYPLRHSLPVGRRLQRLLPQRPSGATMSSEPMSLSLSLRACLVSLSALSKHNPLYQTAGAATTTVLRQLLAKAIGTPREAPHTHAHLELLPPCGVAIRSESGLPTRRGLAEALFVPATLFIRSSDEMPQSREERNRPDKNG
jgi:hypothetical protein